MNFNLEKCHAIQFGKGPQVTYTLNDRAIEVVDHEKDLGVIVPSNLTFEEQVAAIVSKTNSIIGLLKRSFITKDKSTMVKAIKTYIWPHIDYCCQVWSPWLKGLQNKIEQIQKKALRLIPTLQTMTYQEDLKGLNLMSIKNRHKYFDLCELYNLSKNSDSKLHSTLKIKRTPKETRSESNAEFDSSQVQYWDEKGLVFN